MRWRRRRFKRRRRSDRRFAVRFGEACLRELAAAYEEALRDDFDATGALPFVGGPSLAPAANDNPELSPGQYLWRLRQRLRALGLKMPSVTPGPYPPRTVRMQACISLVMTQVGDHPPKE